MSVIFWRELKAYFTSPIGWIFVGFFILMAGIFFAITNLIGGAPDFKGVLGSLLFVFLFVVPLLTMRLLAEETRSRTDQMLITSPVSITGIVMGKYLAALAIFFVAVVLTFAYPLIMSFYLMGPLALGEIAGGYLGFILLGAAFIAVGLFVSSLTENPVVAGLGTFAALLSMWILDWVQPSLPKDALSGLLFLVAAAVAVGAVVHAAIRSPGVTAGLAVVLAAALALSYLFARDWYKGLIVRVAGWFSLVKRYQDFGLGVFTLSPVVYYLTFSATFVFLTIRMLEKRRWA
jgi:ABC-2 type transport system permease protein